MNLSKTFIIDLNKDFANTYHGLFFDLCPLKYFEPKIQGLTWKALGVWTKNHPQVVGTCPGHGPQLVAQDRLSKNCEPEPPPPLNKQE